MNPAGFVLINKSTQPAAGLPAGFPNPEWLATVASALTAQLVQVASAWGVTALSVRVSDGTDLAPGEEAIVLLDTLPDVPQGTIAYHDVNGNDVPVAYVGLDQCATLNDVSKAISHEAVESVVDPTCNYWAANVDSTFYALEACDAVESYSYVLHTVCVSDFLWPAFFDPNSPPDIQLSQCRNAVSPFLTAFGGYQIVQTAGEESTVTGDAGGPRGHLVKARTHHWSSRATRRGILPAARCEKCLGPMPKHLSLPRPMPPRTFPIPMPISATCSLCGHLTTLYAYPQT